MPHIIHDVDFEEIVPVDTRPTNAELRSVKQWAKALIKARPGKCIELAELLRLAETQSPVLGKLTEADYLSVFAEIEKDYEDKQAAKAAAKGTI